MTILIMIALFILVTYIWVILSEDMKEQLGKSAVPDLIASVAVGFVAFTMTSSFANGFMSGLLFFIIASILECIRNNKGGPGGPDRYA